MKVSKLWILFPVIWVGGTWAGKVTLPDNQARKQTTDDFMPHPKISDDFNETWRYSFVFRNGTKVFLNYLALEVPVKGSKSGTNISLFDFRGKQYQVGREYDRDNLTTDASEKAIYLNRKSRKNHFYMKGLPGPGHEIHFRTTKGKGYYLHLEVTEAAEALIPGDGVAKLGKQQAALYIHIPYGKVEGRLAVGGDTLNVRGTVYMEHTWQTKLTTDMASHSLQIHNDSSFACNLAVASKRYGSGLYGYAVDIKNGRLLTPRRIESRGKKLIHSSKPAKNPVVTWNEPGVEPMKIEAQTRQQTYSVFSTIDGGFSRWVAKKAMGGEVKFLRGTAKRNGRPVDYSFFYIDD